jgi:hypothetical protein
MDAAAAKTKSRRETFAGPKRAATANGTAGWERRDANESLFDRIRE